MASDGRADPGAAVLTLNVSLRGSSALRTGQGRVTGILERDPRLSIGWSSARRAGLCIGHGLLHLCI